MSTAPGRLIVPGVHLMCETLHSSTSDLPAPKRPATVTTLFATTTDGALEQGAMTAICSD